MAARGIPGPGWSARQTLGLRPGGAPAPRPSARGRRIFPGGAMHPILRPNRTPAAAAAAVSLPIFVAYRYIPL